MGGKRPYPGEGATPGPRHGTRNSHNPQSSKVTKKKPKTSRYINQGSNTNFTNVRHRARAIRRLLDKDHGLPANIRNDMERELAAHSTTIQERDRQRDRSKMISQYHMVRFFERQKAGRMVKRVKKQITAATPAGATATDDQPVDMERLRNDLHIAEVDVAYTRYFPFLEKYVSLYPSHEQPPKTLSQDEKYRIWLDKPRPAMWKAIELAMESGQDELERIRDKTDVGQGRRRPGSKTAVERDDQQAEGDDRQAEDVGMSDGDGGGFFDFQGGS